MEGFPKVEQIELVETLSNAQRDLLGELLKADDPQAMQGRRVAETLADAELVVYWLNDGRALVAPRAPNVRVGTSIVMVGWERMAQKVSISDDQVVEKVELSLAARVEPASSFE